jgi:hypothetical protein
MMKLTSPQRRISGRHHNHGATLARKTKQQKNRPQGIIIS